MAQAIQLDFESHFGRHTYRLWLDPASDANGLQLPQHKAALKDYPLHREQWHLPFSPHVGRFYPSRQQDAAFPAAQFRITALDNETLTLDFNLPISNFAVALSRVRDEDLPEGILKPGQLLPWAGMEVPLTDRPTDFAIADAFIRQDEQADGAFYAQPRLTNHIDTCCMQRLSTAYQQLIPADAQVLDLMSSCYSYFPAHIQAVGLGMNATELEHNTTLASHVVHDLNQAPRLPFDAEQFDCVVISLSIEYLTQPDTVLADIRRVLKPGGRLIISFSHRYFPTKVISLWTQLHPMERVQWVIQLLQQAGYDDIHSLMERGLPRPHDDTYAGQFREADPLFLIWALA